MERGVRRLRGWVVAAMLLGAASPGSAAETSPDQPYDPPRVGTVIRWPGDRRAGPPTEGFCFLHSYSIAAGHRGGLMASPHNSLFFPKREDLDLFEGPLHALSQRVRVLPTGHPLTALQNIPSGSAGGRVWDELLGEGFARWPRDSSDHLPDWVELFHDNYDASCDGGHSFVHHAPRPGHQIFARPTWPVIRDRHDDERREQGGSLRPDGHFGIERDF